jgi:hypothetical protein
MISILYKFFCDFGLTDWAVFIVVVSLFVDITPGIKFNPVSFVVKKLGEAFNHSVDKKLNELEDKVDDRLSSLETQITELSNQSAKQQRAIDVAEVNRLKKEILDFSNRLSRGQTFTAEEYRTVMDCHKRYHDIIKKYDDLTNGRIDPEYNVIIKHYENNKECGKYMF